MATNSIKSKLEAARKELLDLTRRNRLLNFKPRGHTSLRIVDEIPAEVYRTLVTNQKTMRFLSLEESEHYQSSGDDDHALNPPDEATAATLFALPPDAGDEEGRADRHTDRYLQTALTGEKLQDRLLRLSREAESAIQERGCNILYLALGLLEWTDREDSKIRSQAPLVLVPVELSRETAKRRFTIRLFDDEPLLNPSLVHLCRQRMQLDLPDLTTDEENPIDALFKSIEVHIADLEGWALIPEIHLGLFTFAKILMYLDLDDAHWPGATAISEHPLLEQLLGEGVDNTASVDPILPDRIDDEVLPQDTFQVLDADSSQQAAILAAKRGVSMVIEGPPGTGKSQTITNIIAECLSENRTVLFVAEKSAALEVVKRRLESVGLGDFVTELHSRKASKKSFMEELQRALSNEYRLPPDEEFEADRLTQLRARLNGYVRALHQVIEPLRMSPFNAMANCVRLRSAPEAFIAIPNVMSWTRDQFAAAKEAVLALTSAAGRVGVVAHHPWRGVGETDIPLHIRQQTPEKVASLKAALSEQEKAAAALATLIAVDAPPSLDASDALVDDAMRLGDGSVPVEAVCNDAWNHQPPGLAELLKTGVRLCEIRQTLTDRWSAGAEDVDWSNTLRGRRAWANAWYRWLVPGWWQSNKLIREHRLPGFRTSEEQLQADMELLIELGTLKASVQREEGRWKTLFGEEWQGLGSDWAKLKRCADSLICLRRRIAANPLAEDVFVEILADPARQDAVRAAAEKLKSHTAAVRNDWRWLQESLRINDNEFLGKAVDSIVFADWSKRLEEAIAAGESLHDWTAFVRARRLCQDRGLIPFLVWIDGSGAAHPPAAWSDAFERQFLRTWLDGVAKSSAILRDFRGDDHLRLIREFVEVDRRWLELSRKRLAAKVDQRRPHIGRSVGSKSGLAILEGELRRKRGHKPIRQLLSGPAGKAIQQVTPCFMMSPISVAQYLKPGALKFDVVIFDEASQVESPDALGAIARGSQLILVGDEKQLPPTNFFQTVDNSTEPEETDDVPLTDLESVLSLGSSRLPTRTMLRWHYRSRHESLIAFSNAEFYDNHLRVFPSPCKDRGELGLSFRHVPDGVYFRSKGRFNRVEAKAVAKAVMEHARTFPNLSLGVGAFSKAQQNAIEDEVEALRQESGDPAIEPFFSKDTAEPFFVKNLETIQGDERDVIFLSVGYGFDENGRITMNFGPLNTETGWRRLNVLITRGRQRCILFSSITANDLRVEASSPRGVRSLKQYLQYAQDGKLPIEMTPQGDFDSPFEESVYKVLQDAGYIVDSQVGCAGFSIDLAIVDAASPGRYVCGIECDGATYHSSATARDRDRLRQSVLEGLGWKIIRVWSTDWYMQPESTRQRLLEDVEGVISGKRYDDPGPNATTRPETTEPELRDGDIDAPTAARATPTGDDFVEDGPPAGLNAYQRHTGRIRGDRDALVRASKNALIILLCEIVEVEGPIHQNELLRRAADLYRARVTGAARQVLVEALNAAIARDLVLRGEFIWHRSMDRPPVRWRGGEDAVTGAELICPEEAAEAAAWIAKHEFGIPRDDLPTAVIKTLGFRRRGAQLVELAEQGIRLATENKLIMANPDGLITSVGE